MKSHPGSTHNLNNESAYSLGNRRCILRPGRSANHTQMDQICAYLGFFASTDCNSLTLEKKYKDWNEIDFKITSEHLGSTQCRSSNTRSPLHSTKQAKQKRVQRRTVRTVRTYRQMAFGENRWIISVEQASGLTFAPHRRDHFGVPHNVVTTIKRTCPDGIEVVGEICARKTRRRLGFAHRSL